MGPGFMSAWKLSSWDVVSRISNGPSGACYGLPWGLLGILTGLTKSTGHPSTPDSTSAIQVVAIKLTVAPNKDPHD